MNTRRIEFGDVIFRLLINKTCEFVKYDWTDEQVWYALSQIDPKTPPEVPKELETNAQ